MPLLRIQPLPEGASLASRLGARDVHRGSMVLCVNHERPAPVAVQILANYACRTEWKTVGFAGYGGATYTTLKECRAQKRRLATPRLAQAQAKGSKACSAQLGADASVWDAPYTKLGFGLYIVDGRC